MKKIDETILWIAAAYIALKVIESYHETIYSVDKYGKPLNFQ